MGLLRVVGRTVGGLVGLAVVGVTLALIAVVGIPLLAILGIAAVVGAVAFFSVGLPMLLVGLVVAAILMAVISATLGLVGFGVLILKIALVAFVLSWLFRRLSGRRKAGPVLVGAPVVDVQAPAKDRYQVEAERELDRELGI